MKYLALQKVRPTTVIREKGDENSRSVTQERLKKTYQSGFLGVGDHQKSASARPVMSRLMSLRHTSQELETRHIGEGPNKVPLRSTESQGSETRRRGVESQETRNGPKGERLDTGLVRGFRLRPV